MEEPRPGLRTQYFAAMAATMGGLCAGTVLGYSSPAGPLLSEGSDSLPPLTDGQGSWFSSIMALGALIGGILGGYLINTFGRRGTMLLMTPLLVIGWGFIVGAQNFAMLIIGRIATGICAGALSLSVPTYIGEFSSKNIRGTLGTSFQLMVTIGIVIAYSLGPAFDSFRYIAAVLIIFPVVFGIGMFFKPESPTFLVFKQKDEECKKALQYFRGLDYDITSEYEVLKETLEENKKNKVSVRDLKAPYIMKPLIIALLLMVFQQISGINAVLFNLNAIFIASGSTMSPSLSSILVGLMQVVATGVAAVVMDKLGRKILLIISAAFMMLSLAALGGFFYALDKADVEQDLIDSLGWLPLVSLIIFIAAFSIGYGPIPWLMMSELFSSDIREVAGSIATTTNWTFAFIITVTFESLQEGIHDYGAYWLFAGFCLINLIFCLVVVPETKGKSLEEITEMFGGGNSKEDPDSPLQ